MLWESYESKINKESQIECFQVILYIFRETTSFSKSTSDTVSQSTVISLNIYGVFFQLYDYPIEKAILTHIAVQDEHRFSCRFIDPN
jgi:hypothetical protein